MESNTIPQLKWCRNVANVIEFKAPSSNLARGHFEQARNAIRSMDANWRERGLDDWVITASYYAKYFSVSALLDKLGLKCENHSCVVAIFDYLFSGVLPQPMIRDFVMSKDYRIDAQYDSITPNAPLDNLVKETKTFVTEIERLEKSMTPSSKLATELATKVQNLKSV